jgi:hypothetical protein
MYVQAAGERTDLSHERRELVTLEVLQTYRERRTVFYEIRLLVRCAERLPYLRDDVLCETFNVLHQKRVPAVAPACCKR